MFDYYPMRVLRELPDGCFEAAMTYASDDWMARLVLGFGVGGAGAGAGSRSPSGSGSRRRRRWRRTAWSAAVDITTNSGGGKIG